ncbi:MAG: hypothetical protein V9F01_04985 [Chitinophagaceae bacterium]
MVINTYFFSDEKNVNLKVWALIPYDQNHILNIFKEDIGDSLTENYLQKTFSISFRIPPPVLTDWKELFIKYFKEAFGAPPPDNEQVVNLFDYLHDGDTIKPREIIHFINNLVLYKKQWQDQIPLKYLALYTLKQKELSKDVTIILKREILLKKVEGLFEPNEELEVYLAALFFNVKLEMAKEVLLKRGIERALRGDGDFSDYAKSSEFLSVLNTCFYNPSIQQNISSVIVSFGKLPSELKFDNTFQPYWKAVAVTLLRDSTIPINEHEINYQILNEHLLESEIAEQNSKHFFKRLSEYIEPGEPLYKFRGRSYANKIDELKKNFKTPHTFSFFDVLNEITFEPHYYIDFVENCEESFELYKVKCDSILLNEYLIMDVPAKIDKHDIFLKKTSQSIDFNPLIRNLESVIEALGIATENYSTYSK